MVVAALDLADRIAEAMDVAPNRTRTLLTTLKTVGLHTIVAGSQFTDEFGEVPELDFTETLVRAPA